MVAAGVKWTISPSASLLDISCNLSHDFGPTKLRTITTLPVGVSETAGRFHAVLSLGLSEDVENVSESMLALERSRYMT